MTTYFKVLGNIKHNGQAYDKGSILSGELGEYQSLLEDGVIAIIDGAETLEEAETIANIEAPAVEEEASVEPENTWEAKPDEPATDDNINPENLNPEAVAPVELAKQVEEEITDLGNYRITGEAPYSDENGEHKGYLEIGTIYELPKPIGDTFVEQGVAEAVGDKVETPAGESNE